MPLTLIDLAICAIVGTTLIVAARCDLTDRTIPLALWLPALLFAVPLGVATTLDAPDRPTCLAIGLALAALLMLASKLAYLLSPRYYLGGADIIAVTIIALSLPIPLSLTPTLALPLVVVILTLATLIALVAGTRLPHTTPIPFVSCISGGLITTSILYSVWDILYVVYLRSCSLSSSSQVASSSCVTATWLVDRKPHGFWGWGHHHSTPHGMDRILEIWYGWGYG